jgi:single-strand DNA-binding protein
MAQSVNKVIIVGNLGQDPTSRNIGDSKLVTFSVATTDAWNDRQSGERKEQTQWHSVAIWNEAAGEVAMQYLKKGSKAYIEGRLETNKYTDKEGIERQQTQVVIRPYNGQLILLDKPDRPAQQPAQRRERGAEPAGGR